jgi:hypothetical protein
MDGMQKWPPEAIQVIKELKQKDFSICSRRLAD